MLDAGRIAQHHAIPGRAGDTLGKVALKSSVWRSPVRGMSSPSTMRRI